MLQAYEFPALKKTEHGHNITEEENISEETLKHNPAVGWSQWLLKQILGRKSIWHVTIKTGIISFERDFRSTWVWVRATEIIHLRQNHSHTSKIFLHVWTLVFHHPSCSKKFHSYFPSLPLQNPLADNCLLTRPLM